jgi:drug/metabolite transporter (DMT)-like permease
VPVPKDWRTWRALGIIGLGNVVAPFMLISWSEQYIASGLAAVLQATAALFSLVVAHFMFADERITPQKIAGLLMGFVGVIILFSGEMTGENSLAGMLGMVLASLCYATFTAYGRRIIQGNVAPVVVAAATITVAAVVTGPIALLTNGGFTPLDTVSNSTLLAMIVLGVVNTFVAYLFYYFIVRELGVSRASLVTYITPVVGVVLGALFLDEVVGLTLLIGGGLIFAGIGIVNLRKRQAQAAQLIEQPSKP